MKAADIVRAAQGVDRKLIVDVGVFDVYEGKGIDPGKKSIAIAVTLQPREKTLTDAGDRRGRGQDRRRGRQAHRRGAAGVALFHFGQIYPGPSGALKQPTDAGMTCLGSQSTTLGK